MNSQISSRSADLSDWPRLQNLLRSVNLPLEGAKENLQNFVVLETPDQIVGTVGLELYGSVALLRSLAVAEDFQGQGHGRLLYQKILERAVRQGGDEIYLLTETAEAFFAKAGFTKIAREEADDRVKRSVEFQSACPASAACMRLILG